MTQHPKLHHWLLLIFLAFPLCASAAPKPRAANGKLKVFILSGQSNMVVLRHVKEITGDLKKHFPDYSGKGFEIVGFGWHQGWNDRINQAAVDVYEANMVNFVNDIRKDLGIPKLPVVIANTGMGGWNIPETARYKKKVEKLMDAQLALADAAKYPDFMGNVAGVETRGFQRPREESPSKQDYHWMRNWETLYLIGKSMGDAMVELEPDPPASN